MPKAVPTILLTIAIILVFFTGITTSFSSDDYVHLLNNTSFKNTLDALSVFTEPYGREYRPLVRISLWFNYLMGNNAVPFKITNLILHILVTWIIYRILGQFGFSRRAMFFGTAAFALHPIHVTSIHFILGRTDLIAALFYFASISLVADWKGKVSFGQFILAYLAFVAALLSKEISITVPLIMAIIIFKNQPNKQLSSNIRTLKLLVPFILTSCVYLLVRVYLWSKDADSIDGYIHYNPMHVVINYAQWIFSLIYPFDLYLAQDWAIAHKVAFSSLVFAAFGLFAIGIHSVSDKSLSDKRYWYGFAIAFFLISLVPISGGNAHRWYLYIPSFGLSIFFATLIDIASDQRKSLLCFLVCALLGVYSVETFRLSEIWKKQSELTELLLQKIEEKQIYKEQKIILANVPFGFKSAYLFTFNSMEEAIKYRFGISPEIVEVSYINLDEEYNLRSYRHKTGIGFKLQPTAYEFILLSALERRFDDLQVRNVSGVTIKIEELATNKKIANYSLDVPDDMQNTFYYFDNLDLKSLKDPAVELDEMSSGSTNLF